MNKLNKFLSILKDFLTKLPKSRQNRTGLAFILMVTPRFFVDESIPWLSLIAFIIGAVIFGYVTDENGFINPFRGKSNE